MTAVRPNVILIVADDMGYGDFGAFNDGPARTPALDQLMSEGVCLTQHYSGSCVCAPARAALLTGRYPHRTGAIDTLEGRGLDRLALGEVTLADRFAQAGYATGLIGKWHLGALDPRYHPTRRGFDEFLGFRGGWQDYYAWRLDYGGSTLPADGRYLTDVFTEASVDFVRRHRAEPFFLHLAFNAPHTPLQAVENDLQPYLVAGLPRGVALIYAMNERLDAGVAALLDELDRQGLTDDTIVVFTSDNGPQFGSPPDPISGEPLSTVRFNCGYNGAKGSVYEGGIRVPAVVRWPAGLPAARRSNAVVHFCDWLPTLASACGLTLATEVALDGDDRLAVLRGEPSPAPPRHFWQWNRYTPLVTINAAMRDGDWKLVRPAIREAMIVSDDDLAMDRALKYEPDQYEEIVHDPEPARDAPPPPPAQLYNVADDPLEQRDLALKQPERAARMLSALESWFEQVEAERRAIQN